MSEPSSPGPRTLSPAWLLLLLPVGLLAGWLIGNLKGPDAPAATRSTVSAPEARASAPATPAGMAASAPATEAAAEPEAPAEKPAEDAPVIVSDWTSMGSALEESGRNGKPILIDFNAEWCGPCQRLKRELFDDWSKGRAVQTAVIPVSIVDRRHEDGSNPPETEELQRRYDVRAFPTLVIFSPRTGRVLQTKGYGAAEQTLQWIEQAARWVRS